MRIIRLENTGFGFSSFREDEVDKVLEFDSESGVLKIHVLQSPRQVSFVGGRGTDILIRGIFGQNLSRGTTRVIHNLPVPNAYSTPFKIYLDITLMCSLRCPFCLSGDGQDAKASLSIDVVKKIAQEIKRLGIMYVKIGGGDPFLHPDFETIIMLLRSAGCFITTSTNSTTVTPRIAKLLARTKVRTSVSLEGLEAVDDDMRGQGHFKKAMNELETLKSAGVDVLLRTTLLRQN
jgi:sulfatase maturation enzyme AslB (radical SAM superfamily)